MLIQYKGNRPRVSPEAFVAPTAVLIGDVTVEAEASIWFGAVLRDLPPAVFERHRTAVESALLETETRLDERTERYWGEIDREYYAFDRRQQLLEAVRAITRDELADAWRDLFVAPETARGMVVAVSASAPPASSQAFGGAEPVADAGAFKRERRYFDE